MSLVSLHQWLEKIVASYQGSSLRARAYKRNRDIPVQPFRLEKRYFV